MFSVVWKCRGENNEMNKCMKEYMKNHDKPLLPIDPPPPGSHIIGYVGEKPKSRTDNNNNNNSNIALK